MEVSDTECNAVSVNNKLEKGDILQKSYNKNINTNATSGLDCAICLQQCIHPARLPCGHVFCYLCIKGLAFKDGRCAMCRHSIPREFVEHPLLIDSGTRNTEMKCQENRIKWFYEGKNGWWQYDDRTSEDIESAYQSGEKTSTILIAGHIYIINLKSMLQLRQNEPTRYRRVKRDRASTPKKGIAGLRMDELAKKSEINITTDKNMEQSDTLPQRMVDTAMDIAWNDDI